MHPFIKENSTLVAALVLPVIFAGFFFISKQISSFGIEPPAHDFILHKEQSYNQTYGAFNVEIVDGKFKASFVYPVRNNNDAYARSDIRNDELYLVNAATMTAEMISLVPPEDAMNPPAQKEGLRVDIPIGRLEQMEFISSAISPDGFELDTLHYSEGNLMTEIFNARNGSRAPRLYVQKDGSRVAIKGVNNAYRDFRIIGWAMQKNAKTPP